MVSHDCESRLEDQSRLRIALLLGGTVMWMQRLFLPDSHFFGARRSSAEIDDSHTANSNYHSSSMDTASSVTVTFLLLISVDVQISTNDVLRRFVCSVDITTLHVLGMGFCTPRRANEDGQ